MSGINELDVSRRLRLELPKAKILVISQNDPFFYCVIEAGGDACLDKGRLRTDLVVAIKA